MREALAAAVGLATAWQAEWDRMTRVETIVSALREHPPEAIIGSQAALTAGILDLVERQVTVFLADAEYLVKAAVLAKRGIPLTCEQITLDAGSLLRAAGLACAQP